MLAPLPVSENPLGIEISLKLAAKEIEYTFPGIPGASYFFEYIGQSFPSFCRISMFRGQAPWLSELDLDLMSSYITFYVAHTFKYINCYLMCVAGIV